MMGYYTNYGGQGWMLVAMWVWPLVVALAVWALVSLTGDRRVKPAAADEPREILKRRFATGELSREDYLQAVATLENNNG